MNKLLTTSKAKATALLNAEEQTITGPESELQQTVDDTATMTDAITGSFLGVDNAIPGDSESRMILFRAGQSLTQLDQGKMWVDWIDAEAPAALKSRALKRGDPMAQRAADTENELEIRDAYYSVAESYFSFAGADQKLASAQAARAAFQPALEAQRAEREQRMEKRAEELKKSAEEFKSSVQKTPDEQKTFKSEADSLEDELGF